MADYERVTANEYSGNRKRFPRRIIAAGISAALALAGLAAGLTATPAHASGITPQPSQAASLVYYGDDTRAEAYAHPGALVVTGRGNYNDQVFHDISNAGGTVLMYLDTFADNVQGPYDALLYNASACGPAVPQWGSYTIDGTTPLADFRTTADGGNGIEQSKLHCVLEQMVADNPQMAGWFADDLGSMSWYPNIPWSSVPEADKVAWRDGAIALAQTFRQVADEHHLIDIVNGTWGAGTLDTNGGGYPDMNQPGLSLADGGFVEHHDTEISYFGPYACSAQWASASQTTGGVAINYAVTNTEAGQTAYVNNGCYAYVNTQPTNNYDYAAPWGSFHTTGLPSNNGGAVAPVVTTTAATGVTTSGATLNGTVNPEGQATTYQFQWGTTTSYGFVAPTPAGSAGSGTSAVNESAVLSGLSANTVYHYRLTATNATGTTNGPDQVFTTAGASAVAYDATGPSSAGAKCANCASLSWTHTVGSGANRALVVGVAVGVEGDGSCFITMKDGSTTIPFKGLKHTDNQTAGFEAIYAMTNPPSGANSLSAVVSGCTGGTPKELTAGSESFTGVNQTTPFGTPVFNAGYSATASAVVASSNSSDMIAGFAANGSGITSSANTSEFIADEDGVTGAGNSAGSSAASTGSNVTASWTVVSDWWAVDAIELLHA